MNSVSKTDRIDHLPFRGADATLRKQLLICGRPGLFRAVTDQEICAT
jgi:hypothetical protein